MHLCYELVSRYCFAKMELLENEPVLGLCEKIMGLVGGDYDEHSFSHMLFLCCFSHTLFVLLQNFALRL